MRTAPPAATAGHPAAGRAAAEVLLLFCGTSLFIALAEHLAPRLSVPYLGEGFYLLAAGCMILAPAELAFRRGFDLDLFGLGRRGAAGSIAWALVLMAVVFPLFVAGYHLWATALWQKTPDFHPPSTGLLLLSFQHIFLVGLPEEFFYRGYVQRELERVWDRTWFRLLGVPLGPAFFAASLLFSLGHLALLPAGFRLAVFFPSLMFGWLYKKTGSIAGGMLLHGLSNILLFWLKSCYTGA